MPRRIAPIAGGVDRSAAAIVGTRHHLRRGRLAHQLRRFGESQLPFVRVRYPVAATVRPIAGPSLERPFGGSCPDIVENLSADRPPGRLSHGGRGNEPPAQQHSSSAVSDPMATARASPLSAHRSPSLPKMPRSTMMAGAGPASAVLGTHERPDDVVCRLGDVEDSRRPSCGAMRSG